ncbi:MAG: hypothetical protein RIT25_1481 [Planctomycetota bacterium]
MNIKKLFVVAIAIFLLLLFGGAFYTVGETDVVIRTEFGRQVGDPVTEPGLHFKLPFIQKVNRLEKRLLEWDGPPVQMPTKEKTFIEVDTFARWRIADPAKYFVSLRDERSAQSRLDDIIGSEVRTAVASNELIEIVRNDVKRVLPVEVNDRGSGQSNMQVARRGRQQIEKDILAAAKPKLESLGIELMDVRIKRVNYNADVLTRIHQRMISERAQIAQRFRSEGEGEAARILGRKERDLREIESKAYRTVQETRGSADAEATRIYAEAFNQNAEAREYYGFLKSLETLRSVLGDGSRLVLSTDSEVFRQLKQANR